MTNIPMPEPVAEVCSGHTLHWAGSGPIAPLCERTGATVGSRLITTTQAEAYADAVRREALEEAARQCEGRHQPWGNLADDRAADCMSRAAGRIRALIK